MADKNFKTLFGKYVYILAIASFLGTGGLIGYLETQGLEKTCWEVGRQDNIIEIRCDVYNPTHLSKYIQNPDNIPILDGEIYVEYYGKWRYTNFTYETRFGNIPDDRKYVFVFPSKSTKKFKIYREYNPSAYVDDDKLCKWSVPAGDRQSCCTDLEKERGVCNEEIII